MKGACVFIFFMIFNSILGLCGIATLIVGIIAIINGGISTISLLIVGIYITATFILGACSKNKRGVLIAYFVLILIMVVSNIVLAILASKLVSGVDVNVGAIIFGVCAGFGGLNFTLALIYFILIGKENGPQVDSEVRNMEYINMAPQYQNV